MIYSRQKPEFSELNPRPDLRWKSTRLVLTLQSEVQFKIVQQGRPCQVQLKRNISILKAKYKSSPTALLLRPNKVSNLSTIVQDAAEFFTLDTEDTNGDNYCALVMAPHHII